MPDNERQFEEDIESYLISEQGGWTKFTDEGYRRHIRKALDIDTLTDFVKETQPKEWQRFVNQCNVTAKPEEKFYRELEKEISKDGVLKVLRHGFTYRNIPFRVCYFQPESSLNDVAARHYQQNICHCIRQWHYSSSNNNSIDMMLAINGIPVVAIELKNQLTGQSIENARKQWMYDRDPKELPFHLNTRILVYFAVDLYNVLMTTKLANSKTLFLPFDQGSNGAGRDGGKGNPQSLDGSYVTSYLWKEVLQKDKLLDIIQKFINFEVSKQKGKSADISNGKLIFPRYHQMDVVRKVIADVRQHGTGRNYLIQHSAGSGKSNSIAWIAYRLASLHATNNSPIFTSVIILTDRLILNQQLIDTVTSFDHNAGVVATVGSDKTSQDLKKALQDGKRIIVCNIQKFPVIYKEVGTAKGKNFAIIADEAHSSQTGSNAEAVKIALGDPEKALQEQAELEGKVEAAELSELSPLEKAQVMEGKHDNLSFFAFTATPKAKTLEMFGQEYSDGSFHPFHEYSMRQAIEEGFILNVLENYTTYHECWKIVKNTPDNPDVLESKAVRAIRKYKDLHEHTLASKAEIIIEIFRDRTRKAIAGKGKMMIVTSSRLAAVLYHRAIKDYLEKNNYNDISVFIAFSGTVEYHGVEYNESEMNFDSAGNRVKEDQLKAVFHNEGNILIVAEKYQTGFDEPLLHTMIVDKRLRSVKAVQTLSRLNRTCPAKDSTFIVDFENSAEDIQEAFQPYYRETSLDREFDVDVLYENRKKCLDFSVYNSEDVENVSKIKFDAKAKEESIQGKITNCLKPAVERYEKLDEEQQNTFRVIVRSVIKGYKYVAQITRLFDAELLKEYTLCSYLEPLLPKKETEKFELADRVKLEYWKLNLTHEGVISLIDTQQEILQPSSSPEAAGKEKETPLEEVINDINERYSGDFTDEDRVITEIIANKLMKSQVLRQQAKQDTYKVFDSMFTDEFEKAVMEAYNSHQEAFESIFNEVNKHQAIKSAVGMMLYRQFREEQKTIV